MKKLLGLVILVMLCCNNAIAASIADELTKLNNLYKEGAITKEEFSKAKEILFKSESVEEKTEPKKVEPTTPTPEQEEKERQLEEDFLYGMFMSVVDKLKQHTITFGLEYPDRRYNSWKDPPS